MMPKYSWIHTELKRTHPKANLAKGVDLNKNGRLDPNELIVDANRNRKIGDPADWQAFLKRNSTTMRRIPGIFKQGAFLKPDNPIHDILSVERPLAKASDISRVYSVIKTVLARVKARIARDARNRNKTCEGGVPCSFLDEFTPGSNTRTPRGKLQAVLSALGSLKFTFDKTGKSTELITNGLRANVKKVDCDLICFITLAVAHEMGWPVRAVLIPGHLFLRWNDNKGKKFNFDQGAVKSDAEYIRMKKIHPLAKKRGTYLKPLSRDELAGVALQNRIAARLKLKQHLKVQQDAATLISLYPKAALGYFYYGSALFLLGKHTKAIPFLNKALFRNPRHAGAYYVRGKAKKATGDVAGSAKDLATARRLDPKIDTKVVR